MDEVAPMEVVIINVGVLAVAARVPKEGCPGGLVIKQEGHFPGFRGQPVLKPLLDCRDEFVPGCKVTGLVGNARRLDKAVHDLSLIIGIRPGGELLVLHGDNL